MQHLKLQVLTLRQRAFSGASVRNPGGGGGRVRSVGGVDGGRLGAADIKDGGFIWK